MRSLIKKILKEARVPRDERIELYRDNNIIVVFPLTHRALQKYASFCQWCINDDKSEWEDYHKGQHVVIIQRNPKKSKKGITGMETEGEILILSRLDAGYWTFKDANEVLNNTFDSKEEALDYFVDITNNINNFGTNIVYYSPENGIYDMEDNFLWNFNFEISDIPNMNPEIIRIMDDYLWRNLNVPDSNNLKESNEIHNSHLVETIPNRYVYHTSNPIFRDKISKEGLIPKGKSESWLSDTKINGKVIFAINSDNKDDWWDSGYDDDIYRIDTSKINNKWFFDPNFQYGVYKTEDNEIDAIITFDPIPLNAIKLIYKGSFSLDESVNIENASTDSYNDIIVDGEKVGYVILSPARKEYYWVDVNLPNPLAIVDIKIYNEFRGKKYMSQTMNWLYNFAKKNGYKSLFLRVDDDSEISEETLFQIYQKLGFSVYRTIDDEDDIFMYKLL